MSPAERAQQIADVERELDELGRDYKVALDHGDHDGVARTREQLRRAGQRRRSLRFRR